MLIFISILFVKANIILSLNRLSRTTTETVPDPAQALDEDKEKLHNNLYWLTRLLEETLGKAIQREIPPPGMAGGVQELLVGITSILKGQICGHVLLEVKGKKW